MKKNRFFGIYYKHQSRDGYTIAVISSTSNEGNMIQVITNDKAYLIKDISQVKIEDNFRGMSFDIHQEDLSIVGHITYGELLSPKKDIMSYYRYLPIECKHQIYSMYHEISGSLIINGTSINFDNGNGYIEGDKGRNFPKEYLWLNAINKEASITLAVATIPLGIATIRGVTCLIEYKGKEYRFGTYNFAKAKVISKNHILITKGKYILDISIDENNSHPLKAPVKGDMVRYIHECPSVSIRYILKKKNDVLMDIKHPFASFEYVFGE